MAGNANLAIFMQMDFLKYQAGLYYTKNTECFAAISTVTYLVFHFECVEFFAFCLLLYFCFYVYFKHLCNLKDPKDPSNTFVFFYVSIEQLFKNQYHWYAIKQQSTWVVFPKSTVSLSRH